MPCYRPVSTWRAVDPDTAGKRPVFYKKPSDRSVAPFQMPCGYCIGCRLENSRRKAVRCMHEASMHDNNCFLTLTYAPENLPVDGSISTDTMQKFWKKMRRRLGVKFKYYAAGEYGEENDRPHYHACVFGYDLPDRKRCGLSKASGLPLYSSALLEDVWGLGRCWIGDVSFESAAYVARYVMKKVYGKHADDHYAGREPERSWSSLGLGRSWYERYKGDVYPSDEVVVRGKVCKPPPYYDRLLLRDDPVLLERIKQEREEFAKINNSKINLDMRDVPATVTFKVAGQERILSGVTPIAVSEIVKQSAMRTGGLDKGRV